MDIFGKQMIQQIQNYLYFKLNGNTNNENSSAEAAAVAADNSAEILLDDCGDSGVGDGGVEHADAVSEYSFDGMQKIEFIVLQGGGTDIMAAYAILAEAHKAGFWKLENIKAIYGSSAGALIGLIILLDFEWNIIDNYLVNRPWQKLFTFSIDKLINSYTTRGFLDKATLEQMVIPLFKAKDISLEITLQELYDITGIDFHIKTTELTELSSVNLSHTTHPEWRVVDALYASSALPVLFPPLLIHGGVYADGGILDNFPVLQCIADYNLQDNTDGILGICNPMNRSIEKVKHFEPEKTMADYMHYLFLVIEIRLQKDLYAPKIKNEVFLNTPGISIPNIFKVMTDKKERVKLLEHGKKQWDLFCREHYMCAACDPDELTMQN